MSSHDLHPEENTMTQSLPFIVPELPSPTPPSPSDILYDPDFESDRANRTPK